MRPCSGSDTSVDGNLSYLDLDTGGLIQATSTSTPQASGGLKADSDIVLSKTSYDAQMKKLVTMEKCLTKLDKLDKLDQIESSVRKIDLRMSKVETRLDKTEAVVQGVEKSVEYVSQKYDDFSEENKSDRKAVKSLSKTVSELQSGTVEMKNSLSEALKLNTELKEEVLDLKSRSMRDNLVFTNIPETTNENTEAVLADFLREKMNIRNISFERVHRIRLKSPMKLKGKKVRPIVAKFTFFKERERVRTSGRRLAGTDFGMHEQYPEEIEERRRPLYPLLRMARKSNKKAAIVKDKLYVEGKEVSVPTVAGKSTASTKTPVTGAAVTPAPPPTTTLGTGTPMETETTHL